MPAPMLDRASLAGAIAQAALLRGSFVLRSGRTSSYYLDKYLFSTRPEILGPLGVMLAERANAIAERAGRRLDRLAGAELGGIPLVSAASLHSGLPCIFVRNAKKDYGTAKQVEGVISRGDAIVLVEDVATTGGQALEAASTLRGLGGDVLGVVATIDRQEGARENIETSGLVFEALFTKADLGILEERR